VQELPALHRQPQGPADRPGSALPERGEPVPVDERDDRLEEGEELLRDARHRVPDRWGARLGLGREETRFAARSGHALRELQGKLARTSAVALASLAASPGTCQWFRPAVPPTVAG